MYPNHYRLNLLLLLLLLPLLVLSQNTGPDWKPRIDELIDAYSHSSFPFNGVLLVCSENEILYQRTEGYANLELKVPVTLNTRFRIASVSKQFAGFLAWQLVEEGRLDMQAPIEKYVPRLANTAVGQLTMQELLTHSSGLPPNKYIWDYAEMQRPESFCFRDLFDLIARDKPHFEPGSRYEYCNTGYVLAAGVMEQLSGKSYPELLHKYILEPLNMKDTGLDSLQSLLPNRAYYYEREFETGLRPAAPCDLSAISAAGGMYSSAADMHRWAHTLFFTDELLSPAYRDIFLQPVLNDYAYGLFIREKQIDRSGFHIPLVEHDGLLEGARAYLAYLPEKEIAVVLLSNFGRSFPFYPFQRQLFNILYGRPFQTPKRSLAYHFSIDLKKQGLDYAVRQFNQHQSDTAHYELNESRMTEYGYFLMRRERLEEALEVFRLNADYFPDSWSAHNSLAEAYLETGNRELARKHCKKATTLNPGNYRGKRLMERIGAGGGQ